ncbi:hypothetical protein MYBA111488_09975 [Mycobacterium basiliense]
MVGPAAAALAWVIPDPIPDKSEATAANASGAAITYDTCYLPLQKRTRVTRCLHAAWANILFWHDFMGGYSRAVMGEYIPFTNQLQRFGSGIGRSAISVRSGRAVRS